MHLLLRRAGNLLHAAAVEDAEFHHEPVDRAMFQRVLAHGISHHLVGRAQHVADEILRRIHRCLHISQVLVVQLARVSGWLCEEIGQRAPDFPAHHLRQHRRINAARAG